MQHQQVAWRKMRRAKKPAWPAAVMAGVVMAGVVFVVIAWNEGGPCLGFAAAAVVAFAVLLAAQVGMAVIRPVVWGDYLKALRMLQEAPGDPNLRTQALAIGREYARLTLDFSGRHQWYTEDMIRNDVEAAAARR